MRLFVAVDPPAAALSALTVALPGRDAAWRWTPPDQWHITVAFLGEVSPDRVDELQTRLARAASRSRAFRIRLAGAGSFPRRPGAAKVLWIGLDGELHALSRLAERVEAAARRSGIELEDRPYRPHLTLARAKAPRGHDARDLLDPLRSYAGESFAVDELHLVRSHLGRQVRHERVATWPLGGPDNEE